jgi:hypothetical protein
VMDWSGQAWQVELGMKKRTEMIEFKLSASTAHCSGSGGCFCQI